jgi:predicted TIM-barrel fold metal-dependent hydrolase
MYKIFSVDDHIVEPADLWTSRLPERLRDSGPRVVEEDGRQFWTFEGKVSGTMGLNAVAGKPREQWSMEPAHFNDMIAGCYDPKQRARDLLSQGVLASIGFPTLPRFGGMLFNDFSDKELADLCVRAWNDYVIDEWCPAGPEGLYVPMMICQVWDPVLAADEVRRCAARGFRALAITENPLPDGLPGWHDAVWDPMWQALQETDVTVCMHIGSSGAIPIPDPSGPLTIPFTLIPFSTMNSMVNLILSPVLYRFPGLRIAFSEAGIGWVPAVLERMDRMVERNAHHIPPPGDLKPSEVFARNIYLCMLDEHFGFANAELIGRDRILVETDFPHSDTPYPKVQEAFAEVFDGHPADLIAAVTHENAERVFNWKMADAALLDDPDVISWRGALQADPYAAMKLPSSRSAADELTLERSGR